MEIPSAVAALIRDHITKDTKLYKKSADSFFLLSINLGIRTISMVSPSSGAWEYYYWRFNPKKQKSRIAWVLDGVVVQEEAIPVKENWISTLIVVNAKGLQTDLSGFSLLDSEDLEPRRQDACRAVALLLERTDSPNLEEVYGQIIPGSNVLGGVASAIFGATVGAVPALVFGPAAMVVTVPAGMLGGISTFIKKNETIQALPVRARASSYFKTFKKQWLSEFPIR